jgi:hypothetical protein
VPVPDEYESPRATYLVARAGLANARQSAATARTAGMRLRFMMFLLLLEPLPLPTPNCRRPSGGVDQKFSTIAAVP